MERENEVKEKHSNKIIFLYRIIVSIIMTVSIILVYILNHLGNSKEVDAMNENILDTNDIENIVSKNKISEENRTKLNDWKLILVNYENEMPHDYTPQLSNIEDDKQFDSRAVMELKNMINDMKLAGIDRIWAQSAYRSPEKQQHLVEESIKSYINNGKSSIEAEQLTEKAIGMPYKSEHNLGLAVDFNDINQSFENEKAFNWLMENAQNYGFILRYPANKEDITKIKYEPWHWRYVGKENAIEIKNLGFCLEEYIEYLKK